MMRHLARPFAIAGWLAQPILLRVQAAVDRRFDREIP